VDAVLIGSQQEDEEVGRDHLLLVRRGTCTAWEKDWKICFFPW
jgi:hypothetical protein